MTDQSPQLTARDAAILKLAQSATPDQPLVEYVRIGLQATGNGSVSKPEIRRAIRRLRAGGYLTTN